MGFNFQAGHADEVLGEEVGGRVTEAMRAALGPEAPLGEPGSWFCLDDELGWSWWKALQGFAEERLDGAVHIGAVDASLGVYVDAPIERELVDAGLGRPEDGGGVPGEVGASVSLLGRLLARLGLRRGSGIDPEVRAQVEALVREFGPRAGEAGLVQVGSLRGLLAELDRLLAEIGCEGTEEAVDALRRSYAEDDDRIDDDPEIQCLCHAWLTATYAKAHGWPMWLVK